MKTTKKTSKKTDPRPIASEANILEGASHSTHLKTAHDEAYRALGRLDAALTHRFLRNMTAPGAGWKDVEEMMSAAWKMNAIATQLLLRTND